MGIRAKVNPVRGKIHAKWKKKCYIHNENRKNERKKEKRKTEFKENLSITLGEHEEVYGKE